MGGMRLKVNAVVQRDLAACFVKHVLRQNEDLLRQLGSFGISAEEMARAVESSVSLNGKVARGALNLPAHIAQILQRPNGAQRGPRISCEAARIRFHLERICGERGLSEVHLPDHPEVRKLLAAAVPELAPLAPNGQNRRIVDAYRNLTYRNRIVRRGGKRVIVVIDREGTFPSLMSRAAVRQSREEGGPTISARVRDEMEDLCKERGLRSLRLSDHPEIADEIGRRVPELAALPPYMRNQRIVIAFRNCNKTVTEDRKQRIVVFGDVHDAEGLGALPVG